MVDLEPWIIVIGEPPTTSLAMWQVAGQKVASLPIFSAETRARAYALLHCPSPNHVRQMSHKDLIRLLADCYQHGIRYAALDPDGAGCRQMFDVREVLIAAREFLKNSKVADPT
jgi:hypothetical protein